MAITIAGPDTAPFTFVQATPAASWPIVHGLGYYPQVTVVDVNGNWIISDVAYGDINSVTVTHGAPLTGSAYLR